MKPKFKLAAAIDIGSSVVRMKIAQTNDGKLCPLETLEHPLNLGSETFTHRKIRFSTMEAGADILMKYYALAHELGVEDDSITLTATTALREARNRDYVCDQIMVKTGHSVDILEDGQEKTYIFREMLYQIVQQPDVPEYFLMAYIGTGSVGIALCQRDRIIYSQNIRTGSLKLNEIIEEMNDYTNFSFLIALEEYIKALFDNMNRELRKYPVEAFYVTGKEVALIASICNRDDGTPDNILPRRHLNYLFNSISQKTAAQLRTEYNISLEQADVLLPALALYRKMIAMTRATQAQVIDVTLCDAMLNKTLFPDQYKRLRKTFDQSTIASALYIADRFQYDREHAMLVRDFALVIFDNLKKLHGFSRRERLYLELASILHDIGKYVSEKSHNSNGAHLINDLQIIGLSQEELAVIANISRYHSNQIPSVEHASYASLSRHNRITVSKLSAILRLADALDRGHAQKIQSIDLVLHNNELMVQVHCNDDILLEQWTFTFKSQFFEEVFGIKCRLVNQGLL